MSEKRKRVRKAPIHSIIRPETRAREMKLAARRTERTDAACMGAMPISVAWDLMCAIGSDMLTQQPTIATHSNVSNVRGLMLRSGRRSGRARCVGMPATARLPGGRLKRSDNGTITAMLARP